MDATLSVVTIIVFFAIIGEILIILLGYRKRVVSKKKHPKRYLASELFWYFFFYVANPLALHIGGVERAYVLYSLAVISAFRLMAHTVMLFCENISYAAKEIREMRKEEEVV